MRRLWGVYSKWLTRGQQRGEICCLQLRCFNAESQSQNCRPYKVPSAANFHLSPLSGCYCHNTASNRHNLSRATVRSADPQFVIRSRRRAARPLYCCSWHPRRDLGDSVTYMGGRVRIDSLMSPPGDPPSHCPNRRRRRPPFVPLFIYTARWYSPPNKRPAVLRMRRTSPHPVCRTDGDRPEVTFARVDGAIAASK